MVCRWSSSILYATSLSSRSTVRQKAENPPSSQLDGSIVCRRTSGMKTIQTDLNSIAHEAHKSISNVGDFPLAGTASSYDPNIALVLLLLSAALCVSNYIFLSRHKRSLQQLKTDRTCGIHEARRRLAIFRFPAWSRIAGNLFWKIALIQVLYFLICSRPKGLVLCGLCATTTFLLFNVWLPVREILHPKSFFRRSYLMFRVDPSFIRTRLLFEIFRRILYLGLAFTFLSYGLHRLNEANYTIGTTSIPLFLAHLQANSWGITLRSSDVVHATRTLSVCVEILRLLTSFLLCVVIITQLVSRMNSPVPGYQATTVQPRETPTMPADLSKREDVRATVFLVLQHLLNIKPEQIDEDCDLFSDLRMDSLEIVDFQCSLEQVFEIQKLPPEAFDNLRTVGDVVEIIWKHLGPIGPPVTHLLDRLQTDIERRDKGCDG